MKLYLIRHGQTTDNEEGTRHTPQTELSELGLKQAETVANRFKDATIDIILSSHFKRAQQTAETLAKVMRKNVVFNDLLLERRRYEVAPELKDNPDVIETQRLLKENFENPDFHHDDEETFWDFRKRIGDFLKSIEMLGNENILAVTHTDVIRMVAAIVIFKDRLDPEIYASIKDNLSHKNTGVTVIEKNDDRWKLITWNDHAHLT